MTELKLKKHFENSWHKGFEQNTRFFRTVLIGLAYLTEIILNIASAAIVMILTGIWKILMSLGSAISKENNRAAQRRSEARQTQQNIPNESVEYSGDRTVYVQHLRDRSRRPNNPMSEMDFGGSMNMDIPSTRAPNTRIRKAKNPMGNWKV